MKNILTVSFSIAITVLAIAMFFLGNLLYSHPQTARADFGIPNLFGASTTTPPLSVSTAVQVGPSNSVRVLATSTARVFGYLSVASSTVPVFCNFAQDAPASLAAGFVVGTSTPFRIDLSDLYIGSIQCAAAASTTMSVTAYQ